MGRLVHTGLGSSSLVAHVLHRCFSMRGIFDRCFSNTNALPHINIGTDVWGELIIMTGVYQHWYSSTLHIRWGLCDRVCQVLVRRGRYGLGGVGSSLHSGIEFGRSRTDEGSSGGKEEGGGAGVRSRPGAARTILLFHIISARPSKQPRMVGSTLGVYSFGLIFVSARTNKRHLHPKSQLSKP